jgi:MtN3 and saliva related transmembrane protein
MSDPHILLGYGAGLITVTAFVPQVARTWRTKRTRDLSLGTVGLLVAAGSLWMVYGGLAGDWPVVATNGGMVFLNVVLATAKLRYR